MTGDVFNQGTIRNGGASTFTFVLQTSRSNSAHVAALGKLLNEKRGFHLPTLYFFHDVFFIQMLDSIIPFRKISD